MLALGAILCGTGLGLRAADAVDLNSLLSNSPFGSVPVNAAPVKTETPVEFRGVFAEGGEYFFNLYITANSRSEWLGMDETYDEILTVKSYDADNQQITVEHQGKALTLALAAAKRPVAASPAQIATTAGQPAPAPAVQPAPPASEQERLSKIADEIRRRRALRQQALQKKTQ